MKNTSKAVLLVLPSLYLLLGYYFNDLIGILSMRNVDPEYIYLTSGLHMSTGDLNVSHIDNPGTPLQVVVAVVFRIIYLFRPHDLSYLEDVLKNSDLYLNMVNHILGMMMAAALYIAGIFTIRFTGSLVYALLLQTAPFFSEITYDIIGRMTPELLIAIPSVFLSVMLFRNLADKATRFDLKTVIIYSVISGFGLSVKLTYLPLLIIPLLVIPGYRDKLKFILFTLISFLLFAFPVLFDLVSFTKWAFMLFLGSGQYGTGESTVVNPDVFQENFWYFRHTHTFLIVIWCAALLIWGLYLFIMRKKEMNRILLTAQGGILLSIFLQVMMVSKQYEYRYLLPALALFPALVILSIEMIRKIITFNRFKFVAGLLLLTGAVIMVPEHVRSIRMKAGKMGTEMENKMKTKHFIETLDKEAVYLLTPSGYGCPFHAFSMMISYSWAGKARDLFRPVYSDLYPLTYQYFTWEGRAKYWSNSYIPPKTSNGKIYFYIDDYTPELYDRSLSAMLPGHDPDKIPSVLLFENEFTQERVYELQLATSN